MFTGPCPALSSNSLKYWGTEKPMKSANPTTNKFRVEFMFANCSCEIPVPAAHQKVQVRRNVRCGFPQWMTESNVPDQKCRRTNLNGTMVAYNRDLPTMPNVRDSMAATIGWGIEATTAPNFPAPHKHTSVNLHGKKRLLTARHLDYSTMKIP